MKMNKDIAIRIVFLSAKLVSFTPEESWAGERIIKALSFAPAAREQAAETLQKKT
jgi:hypothetical protein